MADHFEEIVDLRLRALESRVDDEAGAVKEHFLELRQFITESLAAQMAQLRGEMDAFRTEFMGRQWGVPSEFLVYDGQPYYAKDLLAYTLLHGVLIRPSTHEHLVRISTLWKVDDEFPLRGAKLYPYWNNADVVKCQLKSIAASDYKVTFTPDELARLKQIFPSMSLEERQALVMHIMETVPDGIAIVNPSGEMIYVNSTAESILETSRDEVGKIKYNDDYWKNTTEDGKPLPDDALPVKQVLDTGNPVYEVIHAIENREGHKKTISVNAAPLFVHRPLPSQPVDACALPAGARRAAAGQ